MNSVLPTPLAEFLYSKFLWSIGFISLGNIAKLAAD